MVQQIFNWILNEINDAGYLSPEAVFIDGTHIKASASMKKAIRRAVPEAFKIYSEQLLNEINEDREAHGKKPFDGGNPPKEKVIPNPKPIRNAEFSTKASIRNALLTPLRLPATRIDIFSM